MNKLGIWGLVIAVAFVVGVLSANPVVEAAQSGWQAATTELKQDIDDLFGDIGDLENAIDAETLEREAGDADVLLEANNDLTVHEGDSSAHGIDSLSVELYTVSFTKDTSPPQSVELNCDSGDTVVSGYVIFPEGDTAEVNTVAINDGEGMIIGQSGATSLVVVTFQIICAKLG